MSPRPRNSASLYVVNAVSSVLTTLLRMTVLVWVSQYLLRRIEPGEYAMIPVIGALLAVAELFPTVFLRGMGRFMVEADARGDGEGLSNIVSSMTPILVGVGAVLFGAGLWGAAHIDWVIKVDPAYRSDAQLMLVLLVGLLALTVATTPFRVGLFVRMRFVEQNMIILATELLRVALLFTLLFGVSTRALWVVVASTVANTANIAILVAYTVHILPEARVRLSNMSMATVRRLMGFSLWTLAQGYNSLVLRAVPALLLNRFSTPVAVSSFYVGNLADVQIRKLVMAASTPAGPALTTIYAREGQEALRDFYYLGGRYYLWLTLFLLPPLIGFAHPLMDLYVGARYSEAAVVMMLVLAAYPFTWASGMYYQIAYAVGRIRAFNVGLLVLGAVSTLAMWYLVAVRDMGATGAALGMGGSYAVVHLLLIWPLGLHLVRGSWRMFLGRAVLPGCVPFAAALAACFAFARMVTIDSWSELAAGSGLSVLVYCAVLFGACLAPGDRKLLGRGWRRIAARLPGGKRAAAKAE